MKVKKLLFGGVIASAMALGLMSLSLNKKSVVAEASIGPADVLINGVSFNSGGSSYYKNNDTDTFTGTAGDYNAFFDFGSQTLELKNYNGGRIYIDSSNAINLKLTGENTINVNHVSADVYGVYSYGGMVIAGDGSLSVEVNKTAVLGSAYGIRAYDYLTIQGDTLISVDMRGVEKGAAYGLYGHTGLIISNNAQINVQMQPNEEQGEQTFGIFAYGGEMDFTSTNTVNVTVNSFNENQDHFAIYNQAGQNSDPDNGDIFFGGSGKVTLNKTGSGYAKGIESGANYYGNTDGLITFDSCEVEITNFAYGVYNRSTARASDDYDIFIANDAVVTINSEYEGFGHGLVSNYNGVLIQDADYSFDGIGYPVDIKGEPSSGSNTSKYGFDIKGASHVIIKSASPIRTYSSGEDSAVSDIDLSGDGYYVYGNRSGGNPVWGPNYFIKEAKNTRAVNAYCFQFLTQYEHPEGTYYLGTYGGYDFAIRYEAIVVPTASQVTVDGDKTFTDTKLYYVNEAADVTSDPEGYNAKFDKDKGILYLKGYNAGQIAYFNDSCGLLRIVVEEESRITSSIGIDVRQNGASIEISSLKTDARRLIITSTVNEGAGNAVGIAVARGSVHITGCINLDIRAKVEGEGTGYAYGITSGLSDSTYAGVTIDEKAKVNIKVSSINENSLGTQSAINVAGRLTLNSIIDKDLYSDDLVFDTSEVEGVSYGLYAYSYSFAKYNRMNIKWSGETGSCGPTNPRTAITGLTNGAINFSTTENSVFVYYGEHYHVDIKNGYSYTHPDGNVLVNSHISVSRYEIPQVDFVEWVNTGSGEIYEPTAPNTYMTVKSDDVLTATYNFVNSQPVFDTRGSATTGYIHFNFKGTTTKVFVVEETGDETNTVYDTTNVTTSTEFTNATLPNGTYRLCAKYTAMGDHTVYLFTNPFVVDHSAVACDWNVTFHAGEGTGSNHIVSTHGSYDLPAFNETGFTAPEGKRFIKWAQGSESGPQNDAGDSVSVVGNLDFFAIYEEIPSFTMTFTGGANVTGGSMANQVRLEGQEFELPVSEFEHAAHTVFDYWDVGGVHYGAGDTIVANSNLTATAVYTLLPQYTLSFDHGDGTGSMAEVEKYSDENFVLPESTFVAPENFEFSHWEVSGVEKHPGDTIPATTDIEAVAKYTRIQVTISFDAGEGTGAMADVPHGKGTNYELPASTFTAPAHKQFKCWSIGGVEYQVGDDYLVTGNVTITAVYADIVRNISFSSGDGTGSMAGTTIVDGQSYVLPASTFTAPAHKEFKCWSIGGVEYQVGDPYVVNSDITIVAVFQDIAVNISVEVEGGSGTQVISGTDGGQVVLPECTLTAPEGKQFDGWIVDGVKHEAGESVTINVGSTIKAAWKDIPVEPETPTNPDTPATPDTPTTPTTPENPPKKGLSGGAIAGIVIASVVVVGVGGFALTWFVILKKTFADFLAIFKKK